MIQIYYFKFKAGTIKALFCAKGILEADEIFKRLFNNRGGWDKCTVTITDSHGIIKSKSKIQECLNWQMLIKEQFQNKYDQNNV